MKRRSGIGLTLTLGLLATLFVGGAAMAGGDPLVGTWHERDVGASNMFFFVDDPIGGVYHVLFYDDHTGPGICGDPDEGPMLWSGFGEKTDASTLEGTFGNTWCPDNADGDKERPNVDAPFTLIHNPDTDTITAGGCVGTRQPHIKTVEKAIDELAKGKYPPSGIGVYEGCDG